MKRILVIFFAVLFLGAVLAPLQAQEAQVPKLRTEMVRLKYLNADQVEPLIRPYFGRWGHSQADHQGEKLLVISDEPEFVDKVLAVIKDIDVKPADIIITAQLVVGSALGEIKEGEAPFDDPVIKELKNLLMYKNFIILDANFIRTIDGERAQITLGKDGEFELDVLPRFRKEGTEETIGLDLRFLHIKQLALAPGQTPPPPTQNRVLISTSLSIKSGEKTVVGVSKLDGGDKGLILILSGKVVK
jgi:hypothetical protein